MDVTYFTCDDCGEEFSEYSQQSCGVCNNGRLGEVCTSCHPLKNIIVDGAMISLDESGVCLETAGVAEFPENERKTAQRLLGVLDRLWYILSIFVC